MMPFSRQFFSLFSLQGVIVYVLTIFHFLACASRSVPFVASLYCVLMRVGIAPSI